MTDLRQPFLEAVRADGLWEPGHRVALAVSGGADSMVLLDLAVGTAALHGAVLSVVTVDHGQHAHSASFAEAVVREADQRGLPTTRVRAELGPDASEAEARAARYAVFESLDVDRVALAHHQRDQAETVLVNLLRGTGPRGLRGMQSRRERFVRPMLGMDHHAVRSYATERGLPVLDDPSNATARYLRNRIRLQLLPLLEEIRPGATGALARSATRAGEDEALLQALADGLPLEPSALAAAPAPLARRRLQAALGPVTTAQLDAVLRAARAGGGRVELSRDTAVVVSATDVLMVGGADPTTGPR
ncbi:MAG: tRNA lysidine(34) synthetase TilS [Myxococcota bacterium]